jgi:hypothetical protein
VRWGFEKESFRDFQGPGAMKIEIEQLLPATR